jgi:hypothetical protein
MDEPIISREAIRAKARRAFARGAGRDEHGMNPGAAAIAEWQGEWGRQYAAWAKRSRVRGNQELETA